MNTKYYNVLAISLNSVIRDLETVNNLHSRYAACYVVGDKLAVTIIILRRWRHGKQLMNTV